VIEAPLVLLPVQHDAVDASADCESDVPWLRTTPALEAGVVVEADPEDHDEPVVESVVESDPQPEPESEPQVDAVLIEQHDRAGIGAEQIGEQLGDVGEEGPEAVNLPSGSSVLSATKTREALSGGGGVNFSPVFNIDARYAQEGVEKRIMERIKAEIMPTLQQSAVAAIQRARTAGYAV
jgi:hypothetical protein